MKYLVFSRFIFDRTCDKEVFIVYNFITRTMEVFQNEKEYS